MIAGTTRRAPCPKCDRGPRDTALSVTVDERGEVMFCHRCGYTEARNDRQFLTDRDRSAVSMFHERREPALQKGLSDYGIKLFHDTLPITPGTIAADYLLARKLAIPPSDADLRWHPNLRHPIDGFSGPALVARVSDARTGAALTLHRTWIEPDGTKRGSMPRMLLGGHRKQGGAIRLWPDESVTTELAIAEGIETALAAAHLVTPVWSLVDAGNMAQFPVLPGIRALIVYADNDKPGLTAAQACAKHWRAAGRNVRVFAPEQPDADMADLAASGELRATVTA